MSKPSINTSRKIVPMVYAYTTPQITEHNGWTKIGYTDRQSVEDRIKQQTSTADVKFQIEWKKTAVYDDGTGDAFSDRDFHAYLERNGVERKERTEWFKIDAYEAARMLEEFKGRRGLPKCQGASTPYVLRDEQEQAVSKTLGYFLNRSDREFLWNAKPRFGKTLTSYDLCKRMRDAYQESEPNAKFNALIVTNRPAIANSWYEDYAKFIGNDSGFVFISETDSLKDQPLVLSFEQAKYARTLSGEPVSQIVFVSLQDLKGSIYFGGEYNKLKEIKETEWDLLIVDEAHEGVDTDKTDVAFDQIRYQHALHLSGTPFKALANEKFREEAIYNWTYADEQKAKAFWDQERGTNPYETLPKLNLYTYQMSELIESEIRDGIEIDGETEEYAFDLNLFFETNNTGAFKHDASVDKFLDALARLEKYPFSTPELRDELKHSFWVLNRVDSAKALAKKLKKHPVFKDYSIVLAAGDGKLADDEENKKSLDKVREAIAKGGKTITLSVGQLTTGITVPEWTAVLMLSNIKSPALYMQAAFRSQNPWKYAVGNEYFSKENAYVFDFDPARTLVIFEEFANDLSANTSGGKGDSDQRKQNVRELLNFFPVIGEDEDGEMVELDAEKVLSIPRKIRSLEVVRRGFMSNFLFQNISNIFGAPREVIDIITKVSPVEEGDCVDVSPKAREQVTLDENGEVKIADDIVIGRSQGLFGAGLYDEMSEEVDKETTRVAEETKDLSEKERLEQLQKAIDKNVGKEIVSKLTDAYGEDLKPKDRKKLEENIKGKTDAIVKRKVQNQSIKKKELEVQRQEELDNRFETGQSADEINEKFDRLIDDVDVNFTADLRETIQNELQNLTQDAVREVETKKVERKKDEIEDGVRNHLRGFTRTIPSFLMAYGDEFTTLDTFDQIVPEDVFLEVTSITLDEFRFLRDGGPYIDAKTGQEKTYQGKLFDEVVFNDSVTEFLRLKKELANYFDEEQTQDIFDYVPPQKTNQIFTPKRVVKEMVDMLEAEAPGCFDNPDKTFADLYMKSGLYIAEIVKRLFKSPVLKQTFPDPDARLEHIFEKQVYGLAPTEIIYRIATNFILGFRDDVKDVKHNFRQCDAMIYAKAGNLQQKINELFD